MSKKEVLASFRKLLRAGSKCSDYNYRNFILRRIREDFRENKDVAQSHVPALLQAASQQIDYVQRIVTVQNLYAQPNSVMDHLKWGVCYKTLKRKQKQMWFRLFGRLWSWNALYSTSTFYLWLLLVAYILHTNRKYFYMKIVN